MTAESGLLRRTFAAFSVHNFRLYFGGQVVSVSGAWMQRVAQSWLVLELTDSGAAVGALTAVQFLPILLLAPLGGLVADRSNKRRLLYVTQTIAGLLALTLGLLILTDRVELWMVFGLALVLGIVGAFDNPTRTSFVMEMVGRSRITNAVALNSVLVNAARVLGPALGGVLIVTVGIGFCFVLNAVSYVVFIVTLVAMREDEFRPSKPASRQRGQLIESLRYVMGDRVLSATLAVSAVFGLFVYEFEVVLPLLARFTFGSDASTFGTLFAAMGFGAVIGGFIVAGRNSTDPRAMLVSAFSVVAAMLVVAMTPELWMAHAAMVALGVAVAGFLTLSNTVVQLQAVPEMRGRALGLRATAVLGVRPLGAPIVGWVGETVGPRWALVMGAGALLAVSTWAWPRLSQGGVLDSP